MGQNILMKIFQMEQNILMKIFPLLGALGPGVRADDRAEGGAAETAGCLASKLSY